KRTKGQISNLRFHALPFVWSLELEVEIWDFHPSRHRQIRLNKLLALVLAQPGLVGRHLHARSFFQLAVVQTEGPVVPGADGAAVFDVSAGEVAAGVRAGVVDDVNLAVVDEDGELKAVDLDVLALAALQLRQFTQRRPGHINTFSEEASVIARARARAPARAAAVAVVAAGAAAEVAGSACAAPGVPAPGARCFSEAAGAAGTAA